MTQPVWTLTDKEKIKEALDMIEKMIEDEIGRAHV